MESEKSKQKQSSKRDRINKLKAERKENDTQEIRSAKPLTLDVSRALLNSSEFS